MKTTKTASLALLATFATVMLLTPSVMAATNTPLNLTENGIITNAGSQAYVLQGGQLVYGVIAGQQLGPEGISFSVNAKVAGLGTSGSGSLSFAAGSESVSASIVINGEIQAQAFPLSASSGYTACTVGCHSQVPLLFTGIATITGAGRPMILPVGIESAYWNPFGGPIVITSLDSQTNPTLLLVVTYNVATINWSRVQLQGIASGTFGAQSVSGSYVTTTNSFENLVTGIEQDSGKIAFTGMSVPSLDAVGTLQGTTTFNLVGSIDCSPLTGLPEGTCTATGASSLGTFQMSGLHGLSISGSYSTVWSVPSLFTTTTVVATVTQP